MGLLETWTPPQKLPYTSFLLPRVRTQGTNILGVTEEKTCPWRAESRDSLGVEGMRHCPYKGMFSSLCGGPPYPPLPSSSPCFFRAQPDQQRTPALGPRSRNGVQFHHQLIKIDRKYKLLLNFYYYYFYPLGSCVSTKLALIKHVVLPTHSLL